MHAYEYTFVRNKVMSLTGIDLNYYQSPGVQRRLNTYLRRSSHSNWYNFFCAISNDPTRLVKFKDYLTRNVSSFFQDTEAFEYLQKSILPKLVRTGSPHHLNLRVWSVGCTHGYDPYSLAIILAEVTGFYRRHYILATDVDHSAIEYARAGGPYSAKEVAKIPPHLLECYFNHRSNPIRDGDGYYVTEELRHRVTFRHQNLPTVPSESRFDIIICRDTVIHFAAEIKNRHALRPGGILFVDNDIATVISRSIDEFETVNTSLYRHKE